MSTAYDITSFVSDADAQLYRELAPESAAKVRVIPNKFPTGNMRTGYGKLETVSNEGSRSYSAID